MILVLNQSTLSLIFSIVRFPGCAKFVPSGDPLAELLMEQPKSNTLWLGRKDCNRIYKERYLFIVYSWTITRKFLIQDSKRPILKKVWNWLSFDSCALAYDNSARQQSSFIHRSHKTVDGIYPKPPQPITGFFLKSRVSEIFVKQIRVNQGVGVHTSSTLFE